MRREGKTGRAEGFGSRVFQAEDTAQRTAIIDTVIAIAGELHVSPDQVAIAWAESHGAVPMIGPRSMAQFTSNPGALDIILTDEQSHRLDDVSDTPQTPARADAPA